mmetsp:Transcript_40572/g.95270  ORF Transcript_40572/g.95270 Transcript_40572/m.95270 type:complete len:351 (-) Transcript_40572:124-1176(-)
MKVEMRVRYKKVQTVETAAPETYNNESDDCNGISEIHRKNLIPSRLNKHLLALFTSLLLLSLGMLVVKNRVIQISPLLIVEDDGSNITTTTTTTTNNNNNNNFMSSLPSSLQFVHIPKNAGTYVENLAAAQDPPLFFGSKREMRLPKLERPWKNSSKIESCDIKFHNKTGTYTGWHNKCCSWWHIPPRMFTDFESSSSSDTQLFGIVRDPIERAISEVRWQNRQEVAPLSNKALSSRIRKSVRHREYNINEFNTIGWDCHFLEQYLYVTDAHDEILPNMDILCFERLDSDLRERFPNFAFPDNNSNTKIYRNESPKQQEQQQLVLDPDVIDLLRSVYARDFELHKQFCSL